MGPALREAGNLLASGITWLYNTLGTWGGALFGFAYAPITMTGMHHSFIAIENSCWPTAPIQAEASFLNRQHEQCGPGRRGPGSAFMTKNGNKMKVHLLCIRYFCPVRHYGTSHVWCDIETEVSILCSHGRIGGRKRLSGSHQDTGSGIGRGRTSGLYLHEA